MKQKTPAPEPIQLGSDPKEMYRAFTFGFPTVQFGPLSKMPEGERHLLNALRLFYAYRHNGFVLAEALDTCTRNHVSPPTWVLIAINEAFQKFNAGNVTLERALNMGKRDREEYDQYRQQQPLMEKVQKRIDREGIRAACAYVAKNNKGVVAETLEKQYRKFWREFYDFVKGE